MRKTLTAALALGAGTLAFCAPSSDMVWKLGTDDGAGNEFQIPYHAWEYGNAPAIRKSPAMDHKTHTFRYTIPENRHFPKPAVVSSLYTVSERQWMENDEIVSNLALRWKEGEGGRRLLQVKCFKWSNQNNGVDGIEILLPGGKKKVLNLPAGNFKTNGPFSFDVVFDAVKGENTLEIRNVSLAKHYYLAFDSITLSRTDRKVELPPVIEPTISSFSGIAHPGDPVKLKLQVFNADGGTAEYEVSDFNGKIIHRGKTPIRNGEAQVSLPSGQKGYFSVACRYGGASARTSYVVVEPVKAEFLPDSRFGCHALAGDGEPAHAPEHRHHRHELRDIRKHHVGAAGEPRRVGERGPQHGYRAHAARGPQRDDEAAPVLPLDEPDVVAEVGHLAAVVQPEVLEPLACLLSHALLAFMTNDPVTLVRLGDAGEVVGLEPGGGALADALEAALVEGRAHAGVRE